MPKTEVLIMGCGIAALALAEKVMHTKKTLILTKKTMLQTNSTLAQGGIAVAIDAEDSWELHGQDTLEAGCFLNHQEAVEIMVKNGANYLNDWIKKGFSFDRDDDGGFRLGKEGTHQKRRILHAGGDRTGVHLTTVMRNHVLEEVSLVENVTIIDLIVENGICFGVKVRNEQGEIIQYEADYTVLATGGIGGLFQTNSNDETITGDGLALAFRAGCEMKDLEFIQFHPTLLYVDGKSCGLISEAVRGEGGRLVTAKGEKIMEEIHPLADLAPRDIVARVIQSYVQKGEEVFLDITAISDFEGRFPGISALCEENRVDIQKGRIPITPGAHFHMGGVKVDLQGETTIKKLFAVGEVSCQGVHGANRLASNSLLECLVFGSRIGERLASKPKLITNHETQITKQKRITLDLPLLSEVQTMISKHVGIVRKTRDLIKTIQWFETYGIGHLEIDGSQLNQEQLETWNAMTVGWLIAKAALKRKDSVGAHYIKK